MGEVFQYYKNLNTSTDPSLPELPNFLLKHAACKKLIPEYKSLLEASVILEEIVAVIKRLKPGKAPRVDELPPEYYKVLSQHLIEPLTSVCNAVIETSTVPSSWNVSHLILIPKLDKHPQDPAFYRPIALNQDTNFFGSTCLPLVAVCGQVHPS